MVVERAVMLGKAVEIDILAAPRQADIVARAVVVESFGGEVDVEVVFAPAVGRHRLIGFERRRFGCGGVAGRLVAAAVAVGRRGIEQRIAFERLGDRKSTRLKSSY